MIQIELVRTMISCSRCRITEWFEQFLFSYLPIISILSCDQATYERVHGDWQEPGPRTWGWRERLDFHPLQGLEEGLVELVRYKIQ